MAQSAESVATYVSQKKHALWGRIVWLQLLLAVVAALFVLLSVRLNLTGPVLCNDGIIFAMLATRILPPIVVVLPIYTMALQPILRVHY